MERMNDTSHGTATSQDLRCDLQHRNLREAYQQCSEQAEASLIVFAEAEEQRARLAYVAGTESMDAREATDLFLLANRHGTRAKLVRGWLKEKTAL